MRKPEGYKGSFFRSNLHIHVRKKGQGGNTKREILALVRERLGQSGIVYCLSRKSVDRTAKYLAKHGIAAAPYHAGMSDEERAGNQEAFRKDDVDVIVATIAFGMGIDKSNVRFVIHRDMPKDVESWYQEIGRAGRDGVQADCVLFYSWADVKLYEHFLKEIEDPRLRRIKGRATVSLFNLLESGRCRHQAILGHFDEAMGPCEASCDICTGVGVPEMVGGVASGFGSGFGSGLGSGSEVSPGRGPGLDGVKRARSGRGRRETPGGGEGTSDPPDLALFESLRDLRKELADAQGVPAYIVFSDRVLLEMASRKPTTLEEMLEVHGVGPAKLERYGKAFLERIGG